MIITALGLRPSGSPAIAQATGERFGASSREPSLPTLAPPPQSAEPPAISFQLSELFRIGYLAEGSDLAPARPLLNELREALRANDGFMKAIAAQGYSDISLRPCDEPADMIQRLQNGEFEVAFATPVVYARQFGRAGQESGDREYGLYEPILQFKRPGDISNPRGEGVMRQSAVFVSRSHPLAGKTPSPADIERAIRTSSLAVSDSNSASGYIYPQIKMIEHLGGVRPETFRFCGSAPEVVKHVIAGLAEIGACEMPVLESLGKAGETQLYHILFASDPIPTDPILLRLDLMPDRSPSKIGPELKVALKSFFNDSGHETAPSLRVVNAHRQSYEPVGRALQTFDAVMQPPRPVATQFQATETTPTVPLSILPIEGAQP